MLAIWVLAATLVVQASCFDPICYDKMGPGYCGREAKNDTNFCKKDPGSSQDSKPWFSYCRVTCQLCTPEQPEDPNCFDTMEGCENRKGRGFCENESGSDEPADLGLSQRRCVKTCGRCGITPATTMSSNHIYDNIYNNIYNNNNSNNNSNSNSIYYSPHLNNQHQQQHLQQQQQQG